MEYSCTGLNNLPDEILMIIFQKLNNIDVLYSFYGINQRLNKIIHDRIFTSHLTFVKWLSDNFIDLFSSNIMLNRFCLQILPSIHDKIQWLDLDSSSIKHVKRVANYPNLDSLGLYNIDEESAQCLFTEGLSLANRKPQNGKQSYKSNSDNRNLSLIEYFFLNELYISNVHYDYIEKFLFDTKTYLQNNVILYVDYESLQRVTHNFARDATPTNSAKISKLHLCGQGKRSNSLEEYFPYSKLSYPLY
ncbi:unnamed protein product [Rotaria sp. Silwood1]|nr:unnamed protein product [Rotaria sp. Silwood1]CAF1637436.1 unnamed protein product [Rotaria sp. Silwood1]